MIREPLPPMPTLTGIHTCHPVLAAIVEDLQEDGGSGEASYEDGPYSRAILQRLQDAARRRALKVKESQTV